MELGAALANDDVAGFDRLATIDLHAEILRVGVAAVARGTYALLMCTVCFSLLIVATGDAGDLVFGVVQSVAHLLAMVLAEASSAEGSVGTEWCSKVQLRGATVT